LGDVDRHFGDVVSSRFGRWDCRGRWVEGRSGKKSLLVTETFRVVLLRYLFSGS
jgi:hypothetical protein